jgi:hypothetical protein
MILPFLHTATPIALKLAALESLWLGWVVLGHRDM